MQFEQEIVQARDVKHTEASWANMKAQSVIALSPNESEASRVFAIMFMCSHFPEFVRKEWDQYMIMNILQQFSTCCRIGVAGYKIQSLRSSTKKWTVTNANESLWDCLMVFLNDVNKLKMIQFYINTKSMKIDSAFANELVSRLEATSYSYDLLRFLFFHCQANSAIVPLFRFQKSVDLPMASHLLTTPRKPPFQEFAEPSISGTLIDVYVLKEVFLCLKPNDLGIMCLVCKLWQNVACSDQLWNAMFPEILVYRSPRTIHTSKQAWIDKKFSGVKAWRWQERMHTDRRLVLLAIMENPNPELLPLLEAKWPDFVSSHYDLFFRTIALFSRKKLVQLATLTLRQKKGLELPQRAASIYQTLQRLNMDVGDPSVNTLLTLCIQQGVLVDVKTLSWLSTRDEAHFYSLVFTVEYCFKFINEQPSYAVEELMKAIRADERWSEAWKDLCTKAPALLHKLEENKRRSVSYGPLIPASPESSKQMLIGSPLSGRKKKKTTRCCGVGLLFLKTEKL